MSTARRSPRRKGHTNLIIILAISALLILCAIFGFILLRDNASKDTVVYAPAEAGAGALQAKDPVSEQYFALVSRHGPIHQWPEEDLQAFSQMLDASSHISATHGEPGEGDISLEEAYRIAKDAVIQVYGETEEALSDIFPYSSFNIGNPENPVWQIDYLPDDVSQRGYTVYLLARTGEVIVILSDENANG